MILSEGLQLASDEQPVIKSCGSEEKLMPLKTATNNPKEPYKSPPKIPTTELTGCLKSYARKPFKKKACSPKQSIATPQP